MTWCRYCSTSAETITSPHDDDEERGGKISTSSKSRFTSCCSCGRVLKDGPLIEKALSIIHDIATAALNLDDPTLLADAHRLFRTAMQRDKERLFSRGRRARTHAAACCLYIALRRRHKPRMLIDLSDHLKTTVYVLGAVFVALSKILSRRSSSLIVTIDPSLFMHRISAQLLRRKDAKVASVALRILSKVTGGNGDWMVIKKSGCKEQIEVPIQLCSAALYIAINAEEGEEGEEEDGRNFSKPQVLGAVRAELDRTNCDSGFSVEEYVSTAAEMGNDDSPSEYGTSEEGLVCRHRKGGRASYCNGLCRECHDVFLELSEGREHGQELAPLRRSVGGVSSREGRDVCSYLNTEKEKLHRTTIWELMNQDYLQGQSGMISSVMAALGATTRDVKKPGKERKRRQADDPAGAKKADKKEKLSSRINYDVLSQICETQIGTETVSSEEKKKKNNDAFDTKDGDNYGDSAESEQEDYFGDLEEDYVEGDYNECFTEGNEGYAYDDLGF